MSKLMLGATCGLVWGSLSAAAMIPLEFTDKKAALMGTFLNRFAIGFVLGVARLPIPCLAEWSQLWCASEPGIARFSSVNVLD